MTLVPKAGHVPIPITVPYSDFLSSSALTDTGHKRIRARTAKKIKEREVAMRRDGVRAGRRDGRDMMVVEGQGVDQRHEREDLIPWFLARSELICR